LHDQSTIRRNTGDATRIQHTFMKVRNGLMQMGLRYDWFKVRTTKACYDSLGYSPIFALLIVMTLG